MNTLGWNIQKLKIVSTVHRVDSLAHMLIVFDSKSSLIHYTFDKIKFLSQLHICIARLNILFLKIYVQNLTCWSWKLGFRGIIFRAKNLRECRILHYLPQSFGGPWAGPRPPAIMTISQSKVGRVTLRPFLAIWCKFGRPDFFPFYIVFFFTFQDENSQKERYGVDMWLAFFFFGLCSQSILHFRFVPLFLKQNKE